MGFDEAYCNSKKILSVCVRICFYYYLKFFSPKAGQAVLVVCWLTRHVFKGVQWGNMKNIKVMLKKQQSLKPRFTTKYLRRVLSWCQAQPYSQELPSSVLANRNSGTAKRLCTAKPDNMASNASVQYSVQKYDQLVACSYFIS